MFVFPVGFFPEYLAGTLTAEAWQDPGSLRLPDDQGDPKQLPQCGTDARQVLAEAPRSQRHGTSQTLAVHRDARCRMRSLADAVLVSGDV